MKKVDIYSDGACSGNPGPGGFGTIVVYKGIEKEISGGERNTTNNRMELLGAISGLEALKEPCEVTLTSDSKYLVDSITRDGRKAGVQRIGSNRIKSRRSTPISGLGFSICSRSTRWNSCGCADTSAIRITSVAINLPLNSRRDFIIKV